MSVQPIDASVEAQTRARDLAHIASDAHGSDILVLDIASLTTLADYFVVCTADNVRMLRAITRALSDAGETGVAHLNRVEGTPESGWVLMDFGEVIVHAFGKTEREFYQLDRLWADAPRLLVIQ